MSFYTRWKYKIRNVKICTFIQILDMKAIKRRLEKWLGQVTRMGEMKNAYEIVFGNVERDGINL